MSQFNKVVGHVWEIVSKGKEDWEGESHRTGIYFMFAVSQIRLSNKVLQFKRAQNCHHFLEIALTIPTYVFFPSQPVSVRSWT